MIKAIFEGVVVLLLVYTAAKLGPDFARYMKIRSMSALIDFEGSIN